MLSAEDVLKLIAGHPHVMGVLDSGACAIQHVSKRNVDGPDERLDTCPCGRKLPSEVLSGDVAGARERDLGGGQYISSTTHTLADLVREAVGEEPPE